ncbi:MAG: alanine--tRNA ligase [Christensenellales bacterium]|jgi:alanyl-tRNA synthetase
MKKLTAQGMRDMFLGFFKEKDHAIIASGSVIPENDPTVLFTTAGMHPLVPYLMGQPHPAGKRLANVQKSIRTGDIDSVGNESHLTFFEMLGNWSLGDYFKKEMIPWSWEFLTSDKYLGIPVDRLAVSVFEGDENAPRDDESADIWASCGMPRERIFFLGKEENWWGPAGLTGPCGPDTEMFYITDKEPCSNTCSPACSCGRYLEIWNDVFMQYNKTAEGNYETMAHKNVDTGMGLERVLCVMNGVKSVYETELFVPIIQKIEELSGVDYTIASETDRRAIRIIADHMRTATFILGDDMGVSPSNVDQGYVLRRLIRRAVRFGMQLGMEEGFTKELAQVVIEEYSGAYPELTRNSAFVLEQLILEEERFQRTLRQGTRMFERALSKLPEDAKTIPGEDAFRLYDTYGFPIEMTVEMANENGLDVDIADFEHRFKEHQQKSQQGAQQRFKGGLADNSEQTTKLHTATHLLQAALRKVLGDEVMQRGSNITVERLRFDFSFGRKVTKEELAEVERLVNEAIDANAPVTSAEMSLDEAREKGAIGLFEDRYGEKVKVYTIEGFSVEVCGGPHVENTGEIGSFKIKKEESSSAGVRRIRAVIGE